MEVILNAPAGTETVFELDFNKRIHYVYVNKPIGWNNIIRFVHNRAIDAGHLLIIIARDDNNGDIKVKGLLHSGTIPPTKDYSMKGGEVAYFVSMGGTISFLCMGYYDNSY